MVSTEKLISAARAMHIIYNGMRDADDGYGLNAVEDSAVFLTYPEFCRRFPDRSAWRFDEWDELDYAGKLSVTIEGVKFFALKPKEEK